MKKRKVYADEVHHVYQRTLHGELIFYSVHDYLVFFTIYCTQARKRGIEVLALCPMVDHIHFVLQVENAKQLSGFTQCYAHLFAWEWNRRRQRKGSLFRHRYGSAAKRSNKQVRTTLAYCNNNPVERKLAGKAEDYRWTFLAYYDNRNPYSPPLNPSRAGGKLRRILKEVNLCFEMGYHLRYRQLERWEKQLTAPEWQQLTDYIIGLWNVIDYEEAVSYYGSLENMLRAFHDNTGSEYEIREDRDSDSDAVYADCTRLLLSEKLVERIGDLPALPHGRKEELYRLLLQRTSARPRQLRKYLHLG